MVLIHCPPWWSSSLFSQFETKLGKSFIFPFQGGFSYHNLFLWFGLKPMLSSPYQVKDEILRDLCIDWFIFSWSNFYVSKLCQKVGLETNLVQIDPGARLLLFGQRPVFQDFIFKQTHKKGRWILFSLFWIVFSSIITSVNPSFSSLWRKLFTPSRNNNKIYSRDTGRSHWESFHHLLRKLRLEFWETHFHICKFSLNIWIVDYLNICKFSLNRVPLGHTLDPC